MEIDEVTLLRYEDILDQIANKENHLLLGNGFNRGLGVNTSYPSIFQKMTKKNQAIYKDAEKLLEVNNYDLESFIGKLEGDIAPDNTFLRKYVKNKVKFDFMQATHEIVRSEIKNVYAEQNEGIFLLLKNFNNYFTLNYDPFLYLLLLNFKSSKSTSEVSIALQPSLKFIEKDFNNRQNSIFQEIKSARENGSLKINFGNDDNSIEKSFHILTKSQFVVAIKEYSKSHKKGWKAKDIDQVVNTILEEEKRNNILERIDDGAQLKLFGDQKELVFDVESATQNLFFLHGAFHIYRDGKKEKKITQQSNKALYDRLEGILNNEEQDIICVFQANNKMQAINESAYLTNCFNKLSGLSGNVVIIGCSLADNDDHIFEQINNSDIDTVYISTTPRSKERTFETANDKFPDKTIYLFDAESISYELQDLKVD